MERKNFATLNLTEEERKLINSRAPLLTNMAFNSNLLFGKAKLSTNDIIQMTLDNDIIKYVRELNKCVEKGDNQALSCIMRLNCPYSLARYAQCTVKYPQGMENLCMNYKQDIERCYQRPIRNATLSIYSDLINSRHIF
ncbi:unnamed protein product [Moneuplotes crassus]|uniref:Uncharacterized protein n=1 Tax=Euplotes crassus TaxID=5936 RepID=A0AAD1XWQ2_EUPCR|nr:unnamed protein product [Moneuplotes crassus]